MMGTMTTGSAPGIRRDILGKPISGPWYCGWHYEKLNGMAINAREIEEYDLFSRMVRKWQEFYQSQFSGKSVDALWVKVNGLE